jgi:hypothetical protein
MVSLLFTNIDRSIEDEFNPTITSLVDTYLNLDCLDDRLQDLPQQFITPTPRRWAKVDWQSINSSQIVGIAPELFLAILKGSIDTEAPIRGYTHTSRQYLAPIHPQMAKFVGGTVDEAGNLQTRGLWELEECRHTPALVAIYRQLSGEKVQPTLKQARPYQPTDCVNRDLYRHGLHRILTEYGATCLYLWLMGHSTGMLRQVLGELVTDEVNHLTKFWGFGVWLYPQPHGSRFVYSCQQLLSHRSHGNSLLKTYRRMMSVLHWDEWNWQHRREIVYTFYLVMHRLLIWHQTLTIENLEYFFGSSIVKINN